MESDNNGNGDLKIINIKALEEASCYDHPIDYRNPIKILETHISWVLLTGQFAYKIKKPVNLGFVDYSTLDRRKKFCEEELRLNKLLADDLYIAVVPIYGSLSEPSFKPNFKAGTPGVPIEYAVKMRQFDQNLLLDRLLKKNALSKEIMLSIASQISKFHESTPKSSPDSRFGTPDNIREPMLDNFKECERLLQETNNEHEQLNIKEKKEKLYALRKWSETTFLEKLLLIQDRKKNGFVRDCHGDLHLRNMVLDNFDKSDQSLENPESTPKSTKVIIFDRIEFNPDFRWNDIMSEVAFLAMDLEEKHHTELCYSFLNSYLQAIGDYEGLELLNFYKVYRAMVLAKVTLESPIHNKLAIFSHYLDYAHKIALETTARKPELIIAHGVSGSGKTFFGNQVAPSMPAIHIRSDIERKRLYKAQPTNLYSEEKTEKTYERLYQIAHALLSFGFKVFVDAAFLQKKHRKKFQVLAEEFRIPFKILQFDADKSLLQKRIEKRRQEKQDASDATLEVLEMQLKILEPLTEEERKN